MRFCLIVTFAAMLMAALVVGCFEPKPGNPIVVIETTEGTIEVELFPDVAPLHVENFLNLAAEGFYDSLQFFRVIDGFMIQTGDPENRGIGGSGRQIPAEFNDSLHRQGTLAMARSGADTNSASSQFYICIGKSQQLSYLDHKYTVFGRTISGLDIALKIGKAATSQSIQRIVRDSTWRAELTRIAQLEGNDVVFRPDGYPFPDRPLKPIYIARVYEKK